MPEVVTVPTSTRVPWNRGRIVGPKPPLKPKHIWALRTRLQLANRTRDLALFNLAVDSKLRGCDLVRLRVSDIHLGDAVRLRATICQRKTGRPVPFEITELTREALTAWLAARSLKAGDWLFPSRSRHGDHLTTRHYSRLVDRWVALIGLDPLGFGTHSLRRTKVALVYKRTGNIRACQLLLGHTKLESTVRYLGIEVDDALILSEQTEI
ncbi:tyrosine-type recombinase/integrase [Methylorubrum extorquens]|uniref:tyrosine-type recombinase/integrase n=1 Tax=Methylorubrum extorquens TaxID=408 RepID=UPI00015907CA|nr:tyrosine-type recombinase/integrase [Methylorubrum extorquens]ABY29200.1 integrase family protein [Methylorubrum extorquens PA1]KQP88985.1 integrase [Methylobacterium sp. Leaf119]WIU40541.1 tyrosine-type recombinase/integrase [Methylorubrum extorquens]